MGSPFVPFLTELIGRKLSILFGSLIILITLNISIIVSALLPAKFFLGIGVACLYIASKILLYDISPPLHRRKIYQIDYAMWILGFSFSALSVIPFGSLPDYKAWILSVIPTNVLVLLLMVKLLLIIDFVFLHG